VHHLLLGGVQHPLADVYAGRSDADAAPLFRELWLDHHDEVLAVISSRHTQTNEIGRTAAIVPALRWAAERLGEPLALVDVGASAGLNLLCDRVRIDYGAHGETGPADAPVTVGCRILGGRPPIRGTAPVIAARAGLDREPVDLDDDDATRWLLACVWPDTGRLERTAAALELARGLRPVVHEGDAATDLAPLLAALPDGVLPCVTTTWVLAYLGPAQRTAVVEQLARAGRERPVVWISAESSGVVEVFAPGPPPEHDTVTPTLLGAVIFDREGAHPTELGWIHPHGAWLDWRA
jgi:hypothetical protein